MTLLVVALAAGSALVITATNFLWFKDYLHDEAAEDLLLDTRAIADQLAARHGALADNTRFLTRTPPISGLIRSSSGAGYDMDEYSTTDQWQHRLERIFVSMLETAPYYAQARYIAFADGGPELVRVNQAGGAISIVDPDALQKKGDRDYVQQARTLGPGEVYFSTVSRNVEHGQDDGTGVLMLRVAAPVFAADGQPFGAVVLNIDYEAFLSAAFAEIAPRRSTYFAEQSGYAARYDPEKGLTTLTDDDADLGFLERLWTEETASAGVVEHVQTIATFDRQPLASGVAGHAMVVVGETPVAVLYQGINRMMRLSAAIGAFLIALTGLAAATLARPLEVLTAAVRAAGDGTDLVALPVNRSDELGELARAFDRKRRQLLSAAERTRAMFDGAIDAIIMIDEHGTVSAFNRAAEDLFGYRADAVIGNNVSMLMPEPTRSEHGTYLANYTSTGERRVIGSTREIHASKKNGDVFPIELSVSEVIVDGRRTFLGIIRDVSDRRKADAERERLVAALQRSNEELDDFAYVASHDLKAPLRVIDNAAGWLEEDLEEQLTGENRSNMDLLRGRVRRMERLLDDLLEHSRIGRKLDQRAGEIVNGASLVSDAIALAGGSGEHRFDVDPGFAGVQLPRMPLQQIFHNLISNAIKHGGAASLNLEIGLVEKAGAFEFWVRDDGQGVEPQYHERIVQLFTTLRPRDQVEGSGMGLAIVCKHIKVANGSFSIVSDKGKGFAFHFTWPKVAGDGTDVRLAG